MSKGRDFLRSGLSRKNCGPSRPIFSSRKKSRDVVRGEGTEFNNLQLWLFNSRVDKKSYSGKWELHWPTHSSTHLNNPSGEKFIHCLKIFYELAFIYRMSTCFSCFLYHLLINFNLKCRNNMAHVFPCEHFHVLFLFLKWRKDFFVPYSTFHQKGCVKKK